jgi:hypothetical protein
MPRSGFLQRRSRAAALLVAAAALVVASSGALRANCIASRLQPLSASVKISPSRIWSGYLAQDTSGRGFAAGGSAYGELTVPDLRRRRDPILAARCRGRLPHTAAAWVGYGGFGTADLAQLGISFDLVCKTSHARQVVIPQYAAWYQYSDGAGTKVGPEFLGPSRFPVAAGDNIKLAIHIAVAPGGSTVFEFGNLSRRVERLRIAVRNYRPKAATVEWIVENYPLYLHGKPVPAPMSEYGTLYFRDAHAEFLQNGIRGYIFPGQVEWDGNPNFHPDNYKMTSIISQAQDAAASLQSRARAESSRPGCVDRLLFSYCGSLSGRSCYP